MLTAVNSIKLLLLIALGLIYFIGLGWLVIGPLLHGSLVNRKNTESRFLELSIIFISGLIINYGIVLLVHSLKISFVIGCILAIIGSGFYIAMVFKSIKQNPFTHNSVIQMFGTILVCGLFLGPILFTPLMEWDARSIWFFHGKMIFNAGSFSQLTGWQNPAVIDFSHADYPNLLPTMAAQIAYLAGYWNEYLPKLSLFFLLVPAVNLLFTFSKRTFSFLFLIILVLFSYSPKLWDGHMDGYLALFFAISMLLLGRYIKFSKTLDLLSSVLCLLILIYFKNEGNLALLAGACAILLTLLLKKNKISFRMIIKEYWKYFPFIILLLIPFGLWSFYKLRWGLSNDLGLGTNQSLDQLAIRINDGSYKIILERVYGQLQNCLMLLAFLLVASLVFLKKIQKEFLPAIIASGLYCLGMIFVYLVTPLNLVTHLNDSVSRTMLSVIACIYIACYYLVSSLEKNGDGQLASEKE
ncbi:MAG TPA: hypothetical protein DIW44_07905 [Anaerolineaceae bacterium]|nr:hypothetical protein [Anaerolineaceae bacterium]